MRFREWLLENASTPGARQGLYPPGYGGMGLYPPAATMNWESDVLVYMPISQRKYEMKWKVWTNPFKEKEICPKNSASAPSKPKMVN